MTTLKIILGFDPARQHRAGHRRTGSPRQPDATGDFDRVEILDLAEINLPFLDEPHHRSSGRYTKPHTFAWAAAIDTPTRW